MPKFFALMAAIAMLFAPVLMNASMAYASPSDSHAQMAEKGHCAPAGDTDEDQVPELACCGAMCMAVAITHATVPIAAPAHSSIRVAELHAFRTGAPAELATPPPRAA